MIKIFAFLIMMAAAIGLDFVWIGLLMNKFYLDAFSSFGRIEGGKIVPILWAAGVVYLIIPAAIMVFVVLPSLNDSFFETVWRGAFLGFCLYGLYDFTNLSTIQAWTVRVVCVDVAWGIVLCAALSAVGRLVLLARQ